MYLFSLTIRGTYATAQYMNTVFAVPHTVLPCFGAAFGSLAAAGAVFAADVDMPKKVETQWQFIQLLKRS